MSTEFNPIEDASKGAVKGALDWSSEFIKDLANRFKEKKVQFIEDRETLELAKEQYNTGELQIYKAYIENKDKLMMSRTCKPNSYF